MKEHSIKASDGQFIRLFRWIAGLQISSDAKLLFARLLDLADGEQSVKASRRFLRAWLSWSDARLSKASSELEKLGWLSRKASLTPTGDCAATEWTLPRIVIQSSETVRVEVSNTGHGVPRKDTVSYTGQSRTHKKGDRARPREHKAENRLAHVFSLCPRLSGFRSRDAWARFRPSLLRPVGKRRVALRCSRSNTVTTPFWVGPCRAAPMAYESRQSRLGLILPSMKLPTTSEGSFLNKCNGFAIHCNARTFRGTSQ